MTPPKSRPSSVTFAFALGLLALAPPADAQGFVALWHGLGSTPIVFGREGLVVEQLQGNRSSEDTYSRILHAMDARSEFAPFPIARAASVDSLRRPARHATRTIVDLDAGTIVRADFDDGSLVRRRFGARPDPRPTWPLASDSTIAADADSAGIFVLVGTDTIAGFPARHYRSRSPHAGFLGQTMPESLDVHGDFVVEVWLAGPDDRLDRFFEQRARCPKLGDAGDEAPRDSIFWDDGSKIPWSMRRGAIVDDSGWPIAIDIYDHILGAGADSLLAGYRDAKIRGVPLGIVLDLQQRRVWLSRNRLVALREQAIPAEAFEPPAGRRWSESVSP